MGLRLRSRGTKAWWTRTSNDETNDGVGRFEDNVFEGIGGIGRRSSISAAYVMSTPVGEEGLSNKPISHSQVSSQVVSLRSGEEH